MSHTDTNNQTPESRSNEDEVGKTANGLHLNILAIQASGYSTAEQAKKIKFRIKQALTQKDTEHKAELARVVEARDKEWIEHLSTCKIDVDFVDGKPQAKFSPLTSSNEETQS